MQSSYILLFDGGFIGQGLSYIGDIMINGVLGQKEKELGLMVVNPVMIFLLDQTMPDQDVNGMENLIYLYFSKQAFDNFLPLLVQLQGDWDAGLQRGEPARAISSLKCRNHNSPL